MTVLLDENIDESFPSAILGHDVRHMASFGWRGLKNGALLARAGEAGFGAFVTADKNMPYQQNVASLSFALIVLDIHPNTIRTQTACVPALGKILEIVEPGRLYRVEGPHPKRTGSG